MKIQIKYSSNSIPVNTYYTCRVYEVDDKAHTIFICIFLALWKVNRTYYQYCLSLISEMAFLAALCRYLKQHDSRNGQHQRCSQPFDQRRILRGNDAVNMGNKRSFTTFSARKTLQPRLTFSAISGVKKWSSPSPMKFLSRSFRQKQNLMTTWTNKVTISGIIVGYVTVLSIIKVHFNYR